LNVTGTAIAIKTGDIYKFRVTAINVVGNSIVSDVFSVMAATYPTAPGTPTQLTSTETTIAIQWTAPTDNGGTPITDYTVMWD